MHYLVWGLVAALLILGMVLSLRGTPVFELRMRRGRAETVRGKVAGRFLSECEEILHSAGIDDARITGYRVGRRTALRFSNTIPEHVRQRIRNVRQICG